MANFQDTHTGTHFTDVTYFLRNFKFQPNDCDQPKPHTATATGIRTSYRSTQREQWVKQNVTKTTMSSALKAWSVFFNRSRHFPCSSQNSRNFICPTFCLHTSINNNANEYFHVPLNAQRDILKTRINQQQHKWVLLCPTQCSLHKKTLWRLVFLHALWNSQHFANCLSVAILPTLQLLASYLTI